MSERVVVLTWIFSQSQRGGVRQKEIQKEKGKCWATYHTVPRKMSLKRCGSCASLVPNTSH